MNRKQQSVVLAGLLALALAGCGSMRGGSSADEMSDAGMTGGTSTMDSGASATGSTAGTAGAEGSGTAETSGGSMAGTTRSQGEAGTSTMPSGMMPNAVVMSIDAMPRQGEGAAMGSSGTAGTTGSMGEDKTFRITLRMDDGATRVVTQDKTPNFRTGDRINITDGVISH